jgi:predicted cupin superfamily sugar epimerase
MRYLKQKPEAGYATETKKTNWRQMPTVKKRRNALFIYSNISIGKFSFFHDW